MSILRKPYEITIWDDVWDSAEGKFVERRIGVIGSDKMEAQCRVHSPNLTRNTNGTKKLTFKLYKQYIDNITGELVYNPYYDLLINERKVKLIYDGKWYDFVVKNIQENSSTHLCTYQLEDALVQELSKNGFKVELDDSLMNNSDTAAGLARTVLSETDWGVSSEVFVETVEENLVYLTVKSGETFNAYQVFDQSKDNLGEGVTIAKTATPIPAGSKLLGFYSSCTNKPYRFQFIYVGDLNNLTKNDNRIVTNVNCQYFVDNPNYKETADYNYFYLPSQLTTTTVLEPNSNNGVTVSGEYRGRRYGFSQSSVYIPQLERYVSAYNQVDSNGVKKGEYYGYVTSEYISPVLIENIISNTTFKNTSGWIATRSVGGAVAKVENVAGRFENNGFVNLTSNFSAMLNDKNYASYMKLDYDGNTSWVLNSGPRDNRAVFSDTYNGDEWGVMCSAFDENGNPVQLEFTLAEYQYVAADDNKNTNYYSPIANPKIKFTKKAENVPAEFSAVFTVEDRDENAADYLKQESQIFLRIARPVGAEKNTYYIQSISLFKIVRDDNGTIIYPEKQLAQDDLLEGIVKTHYYFFKQSEASADQIPIYAVQDKIDYSTFVPVMVPGAEKIRTVSAKESNYFNVLQSIAETFEAWMDFDIERDENTGAILSKKVFFRNYIGKQNPVGIRYGINLKDIQRTFESKQLVTKLIVKNNSNELADNGFCSIAKAGSNPTGENYIYDFQYFFNCGLMNARDYLETLYSYTGAQGADIDKNHKTTNLNGYFPRVKSLNQKIDEANAILIDKSRELTSLTAKITVAEAGSQAALSSIEETENAFLKASGGTKSIQEAALENYSGNDTIKKLLIEYSVYCADKASYDAEVIRLSSREATIRNTMSELNSKVKGCLAQKSELNKLFFTKYSRFIQEGTWIDEKYINDNSYYNDALSVMYNSCYPKAAYTINVVEISQLPGYEDFNYQLGDTSFVEDKEFFGTAGKVEVVITEVSENLDDPSQNKIKVQTFKNQFQDLFQKITAAVQTAQYSTGSYQKAVALAEANQERKNQFVTDALAGAEAKLQIAGQQSVIIDEGGITITDVDSPSDSIRMIGGAILLSKQDKNGNKKWATGITSDGVSANLITAGVLNAGEITIMNYDEPCFRWDSFGLTAFDQKISNLGEGNLVSSETNTHKFVRFDKHGIYGIDEEGGVDGMNWVPSSEKDIFTRATFYLTWDGLKVAGSGDSEIVVGKTTLSTGNPAVIRATNEAGQEVFTVDTKGNVSVMGDLRSGSTIGGKTPVDSIATTTDIDDVKTLVGDLQTQVDNKTEFWFGEGVPSENGFPAKDWTEAEKEKHVGDVYYDETNMHAYRWENKQGTYAWVYYENAEVTQALADIKNAQDTADGKMAVFQAPSDAGDQWLPEPPYQVGDLWVNASYKGKYTNELLRCKTTTEKDETASIEHWMLATKYTDDTVVNDFISNTYESFVDSITQQVDAKADIYYQDADPATYSGTEKWGDNRVGDLWRCTSTTSSRKSTSLTDSNTFVTRKANSEWVWTKLTSDGYGWKEMEIPDNVFDAYDGKATLYVSIPSGYKANDLWILDGATYGTANCPERLVNNVAIDYPIGTLLIAKDSNTGYSKTDWEEKTCYTDDTVANSKMDPSVKGDFSWDFNRDRGLLMWSGEPNPDIMPGDWNYGSFAADPNLVFKVGRDSEGAWVQVRGKGEFTGSVTAQSGYIGGEGAWIIEPGYLKTEIKTGDEVTSSFNIGSALSKGDNWLNAIHNGQSTFALSKAGILTAKGANIEGTISASKGRIGTKTNSFTIDMINFDSDEEKVLALFTGLVYDEENDWYELPNSESYGFGLSTGIKYSFPPPPNSGQSWITDKWVMLGGGTRPNFGLTQAGDLYAYNAHIYGHIDAISGKIGGFEIGQIKFPQGSYFYEALHYGLQENNGEYEIGASGFVLAPEGVYKKTSPIQNYTGSGYWKMIIGDDFGVYKDGRLFSSGGKIGCLTISDDTLTVANKYSLTSNGISFTQGELGIGSVTFVTDEDTTITQVEGEYIIATKSGETTVSSITLGESSGQEINILATLHLKGTGSYGDWKGEIWVTTDTELLATRRFEIQYAVNSWGEAYPARKYLTLSVKKGAKTSGKATITDSAFSLTDKYLAAQFASSGSAGFPTNAGIVDHPSEVLMSGNKTADKADLLYIHQSTGGANIKIQGSLLPSTTKKYTLGQEGAAWSTAHIDSIYSRECLTNQDMSDIRVKNSIEDLSFKYERFFDRMAPKRYKYKDGTSDRYHTGFVAQQLVEALTSAELSTQEFAGVMLENPGTAEERWYLRRDEFVALNTWQIQKLKPRMTAAEQEIEYLKSEVERLNNELENLKKS